MRTASVSQQVAPCLPVVPATGEVLEDGGRPWRQKRMGAERVAAALQRIGLEGPAARCRECGTVLVFRECAGNSSHYRRLQHANFCRVRLCPMCTWRRSLRLMAITLRVVHAAVAEDPRVGWVLLTLTQRNVGDGELAAEIGRILRGWISLRKRRELRGVRGWLRTLEVTYNEQAQTWHPHLHVLLAVRPSYWSRDYIPHARWVDLWAESLGLDYRPSVEVHAVRPRPGKRGRPALAAAVAEVTKYQVKDQDLWAGVSDEELDQRLAVLLGALWGRRLYDWGGWLRRIARSVGDTGEELEDLVHVDPDGAGAAACPVCSSSLVEHLFRWLGGQYVG